LSLRSDQNDAYLGRDAVVEDMSSAATGRAREYRVIDIINPFGFFGTRKPASKGPYDVFGFNMSGHPPHVAIQAGGESKTIGRSLDAIRTLFPNSGVLPMVVCWRGMKQHWYCGADGKKRRTFCKHKSFPEALEHAKEALS